MKMPMTTAHQIARIHRQTRVRADQDANRSHDGEQAPNTPAPGTFSSHFAATSQSADRKWIIMHYDADGAKMMG